MFVWDIRRVFNLEVRGGRGPYSTATRFSTVMQVFTDNGTITAAELAARIERIETFGKAGLGPAIVARAWADPAFKVPLGLVISCLR